MKIFGTVDEPALLTLFDGRAVPLSLDPRVRHGVSINVANGTP
jgi:hypothetical protein